VSKPKVEFALPVPGFIRSSWMADAEFLYVPSDQSDDDDRWVA